MNFKVKVASTLLHQYDICHFPFAKMVPLFIVRREIDDTVVCLV